MARRIAITGASGQVGGALQRIAPDTWDISATTSADVDVTSWTAVRDWLATVRPQLIFHAAAMTDVDGCEYDPRRAYLVNALGARNVARAAERIGATLVYLSTNFVFSGEKPTAYHEFDEPAPLSTYGSSKLAGEREVQAAGCPAYIVRTAMVFDESGRNFVSTMRRLMAERDVLSVVDDQYGNPTYAVDLAAGMMTLLDRHIPGTYHLTNGGATSWFGWASEVRRLTDLHCDLQPIPASKYPRAATPPSNGEMESLAIGDAEPSLPSWRDALARCLT